MRRTVIQLATWLCCLGLASEALANPLVPQPTPAQRRSPTSRLAPPPPPPRMPGAAMPEPIYAPPGSPMRAGGPVAAPALTLTPQPDANFGSGATLRMPQASGQFAPPATSLPYDPRGMSLPLDPRATPQPFMRPWAAGDPGALPPLENPYPYAQPASPGVVFADPNDAGGYYEQMMHAGGAGESAPWFAMMGGLIMARSQINNRSLTLNGAGGTVLNQRDSFNNPWAGGFEARLGRTIGQRSAVEFGYWMLAPLRGVATVSSPTDDLNSALDFVTNGPLVVTGRPATDFFFNSSIQQYERISEVWNLEVNYLRLPIYEEASDRFGIVAMAGARWFHFREVTDYAASTAGTTFDQFDGGNVGHYIVKANNDLIGAQVGARMHYCPRPCARPCVRWFAYPKVGIYGNSLNVASSLHCGCLTGGTDGFDASIGGAAFSVLGQLDTGLSWQVTPAISLFAAYRVVGVSQLALADDQYRQIVADAMLNPWLNTAGSLILQGALVGGQVAF